MRGNQGREANSERISHILSTLREFLEQFTLVFPSSIDWIRQISRIRRSLSEPSSLQVEESWNTLFSDIRRYYENSNSQPVVNAVHLHLARTKALFQEFKICQSGSVSDRRKSMKINTAFLDLISQCEDRMQASDLRGAADAIQRLQTSISTDFELFFKFASMDRFQKSQRIAEIGKSLDAILQILSIVPSLSIPLPPEVHEISRLIHSLKPAAKARPRKRETKPSKIPVGRSSLPRTSAVEFHRSKSVPKIIPSLLASRKSITLPPPERPPPINIDPVLQGESLQNALRIVRRIESRCQKLTEIFGANEVIGRFLREIQHWRKDPTVPSLDALLSTFDSVESELNRMDVRSLLNFQVDDANLNAGIQRIVCSESPLSIYEFEAARLKQLTEKIEAPVRRPTPQPKPVRSTSPRRSNPDKATRQPRALSPPAPGSRTPKQKR
jgi:hypothetical protein